MPDDDDTVLFGQVGPLTLLEGNERPLLMLQPSIGRGVEESKHRSIDHRLNSALVGFKAAELALPLSILRPCSARI